MEKEVSFFSNGCRLIGVISLPDKIEIKNSKIPGIIFSHGYGSDKDESGDFVLISKKLREIGVASLRFDMRGSWLSDHVIGKKLCGTEWKEDLISAVHFVSAYPGIDPFRIGVIGESMGGANVINAAAEETRIKNVVALSPISDGYDFIKQNWLDISGEKGFNLFLKELEEDRFRRTRYGNSNLVKLTYALAYKKRYVEIVNSLNESVVNKYFSHYVRFESIDSILKMKPIDSVDKIAPRPLLIMGGKNDEIVPWKRHGEMLFKKAKKKKRMVLFSDGDHKLLNEPTKENTLNEILNWVIKYL